jgi:hypothetical protein
MPYLTKTGGAACKAPPAARGNLFGDIVCPECGTQIITPPQCQVRPGWGRCPTCKKPFKVTRLVACYCNEKQKAVNP